MEINLNHHEKILSVWLSQSESEQLDHIREQLKPMFLDAKRKKYTPFIYISGNQDLYSSTSDVLCHNLKKM